MKKAVRVRFAPSPTGHLHVGGARTAIYNWIFARANAGTMIIRCEDTDLARSTREAEESVLQDLRWLGLEWSEGPDKGGPHAPYRQSERQDIYREYAQKLLKAGKAFECFCTDEELEKKREAALAKGEAPQYDGTCRKLSAQERASRVKNGNPFSVRFIVEHEDQVLQDHIRDQVVFKAGMVGDFVLLRSNGLPTYNFACVVDDGLMEITHVIRAEEHLPNTNRQLMLYKALGMPIPEFAHVSLVMGRDPEGNVSKLSKRHGATSVDQYKCDGFLKEAMINYLTQLGWSHPEGKEIFDVDDLTKHFSLGRIGKSPSVFDLDKLSWMNGMYIRALPAEETLRRALPFVDEAVHGWFLQKPESEKIQLISLLQSGLTLLKDVNTGLKAFVGWSVARLEPEAAEFLKATPESHAVLKTLHRELDVRAQDHWVEADVKALIDKVKTETKAKGKALFMGIRVGVSGSVHGVDLTKMMALLGRSECAKRLELVIRHSGI